MLGERVAQVFELRACGRFDLLTERDELVRRAPCGEDRCFELDDAERALPQLRHELWHIVRERDRPREPLLLGTCGLQLRFEHRHIGFALRQLRCDLVSDLRKHELKHAITQHVLLQMIDERAFHLGHRLMNRDPADRTTALMMLRAAVAENALVATAVRANPRRTDRTAARATLRDARQRVLRRRSTRAKARTSGREALLHREPDRVVDHAPLGQVHRDHLARISFDADRSAALANLLDATVDVDAAIARVEQDRANGRWCPRSAAATARGGRGYTFVVEAVCNLLQAAMREIVIEDAPYDERLLLVDRGRRVAATRPVVLALELVAVASAAGDASITHPRTKRFAGARADRLELHLVPGALDERGRLIDRVRELHLLTRDVVEEPASSIANEVSNHERHFDRIATEARLIAAHDDVAALRVDDQLAQPRARDEVVARSAVVEIRRARLVGEAHACEVLLAALRLHVEAELLLALIVLRSSAVGSDHGFLAA